MRPDQTEGIDEARRTDMNNEIYPLDEYEKDGPVTEMGRQAKKRRSANQRLTPIFAALAKDSEGWELEQRIQKHGATWEPAEYSALQAFLLYPDGVHVRLVPKRKIITVEIPVPEGVFASSSDRLCVDFSTVSEAEQAYRAIHKEMEGK